jgi:hypothetical protein
VFISVHRVYSVNIDNILMQICEVTLFVCVIHGSLDLSFGNTCHSGLGLFADALCSEGPHVASSGSPGGTGETRGLRFDRYLPGHVTAALCSVAVKCLLKSVWQY